MPAPPNHLSTKLKTAIKAAQYKEALINSEELLRTYPLWLDLQHGTATALAALGASDAQRVVTQEVLGVVARFPLLPHFLFEGDLPFASDETLAWLEAQRGASAGPGPAPEAVPAGLAEGLAALQERLARTSARSAQYLLRLQMAEHCLLHKRPEVAAPLLEQLLAEGDEHGLRLWDAGLLARALRLLVLAARALKRDASQRAQIYARLCQIDPSEAIRLGAEGA